MKLLFSCTGHRPPAKLTVAKALLSAVPGLLFNNHAAIEVGDCLVLDSEARSPEATAQEIIRHFALVARA